MLSLCVPPGIARAFVQTSAAVGNGRSPTSALGQSEKKSVRAYVFRFALELGHCATQSGCLKRAMNRRLQSSLTVMLSSHGYIQNSEVTVVHDLIAAAEVVADERAFVRLLQLMVLDRQDEQQKELARPSSPCSAGANGWENYSIEAFLEAAAAWAEATSRTTTLGAEASDAWRRAAMIVVAGAFYE